MSEDTSNLSALFDNEDVNVDLSPPVFDGVTVTATLKSIEVVEERSRSDFGSPTPGQTVVLKWESDDEAAALNGKTYQPGFALSDRFKVKPASDTRNREDVQRIALEKLGKIAKTLGKIESGSPTAKQIMEGIERCKGLQMQLHLSKRDGNDGAVYQQIKYARPALS